MNDRRDFLKMTQAIVLSAMAKPVDSATKSSLGSVDSAVVKARVIQIAIGNKTLRVQALETDILRLDLLAHDRDDPHTPVLDPHAVFSCDPAAKISHTAASIRLHTKHFELLINRNPCRLTLLDAQDKVLLYQTSGESLWVDPEDQARNGFTFRCGKSEHFYGIRTSGCYQSDAVWTYQNHPLPMIKDGRGMKNGMYTVEAGKQGSGGAPFAWTTNGYGILVDSDGGYFQMEAGKIGFHYGNPEPAQYPKQNSYGRHYFRPNSLTVFLFVGNPRDIFRSLAQACGKMPLFPKWAYGFTNSQWGTDQKSLREYLQTYRAQDIPIDNFTLDFDWKDWGASHYGEFRWNPVKYPQALYPSNNPDALINWTRALECKITGIMKPRIIISTVYGHANPMTTQGAAAKKSGIFLPTEKAIPDYFSKLLTIGLDFYKPICRQWYWRATWVHQCMQHGIAGFWNDEADFAYMGNFEFLHMQQALYEGQRQNRPRHRVWSMNRNFYLGAQRFAYATWSGDIKTGFQVMRQQTLAMINTMNLGQMRWAQDTGGFIGHPTPECYTRWFQFTAVCPTLRTHCTLGERRQPWVFGDQACQAVKQAIRQRYSWFFYTYAIDHDACTRTGIGIVRPLTFDYPDDHTVAAMSDQWMFGDWILAAPVLEKLGNRKGEAMERRIYLPKGDWIDYFRGTQLSGGQWITYRLNAESWMDWPLFIKAGAIIPTADPVKAIHTAKPEMIYLDIYPAKRESHGKFYDDDGDSYDYQHGMFHQQSISVKRFSSVHTEIHLSANSGRYQSSVQNFVLRVHGHAARKVMINDLAVNAVIDGYALLQTPSGWFTDVDVIGPVTYIKIPAGQKLTVQLHGQQMIRKDVEILSSGDASLSGPAPSIVPLQNSLQMYAGSHLFALAACQRPTVATKYHGYTAGGYITGFSLPGTAATFYLRRRKSGSYLVTFRVANADINAVKTINVYVNGLLTSELRIASLAGWNDWENIEMYLPLAMGNNTIMLRYDQNNTGKINLDSVHIPWEPSI